MSVSAMTTVQQQRAFSVSVPPRVHAGSSVLQAAPCGSSTGAASGSTNPLNENISRRFTCLPVKMIISIQNPGSYPTQMSRSKVPTYRGETGGLYVFFFFFLRQVVRLSPGRN